jgi:hypothetical protein
MDLGFVLSIFVFNLNDFDLEQLDAYLSFTVEKAKQIAKEEKRVNIEVNTIIYNIKILLL